MIRTVKQVWICGTCFEFNFDDIYFKVTVSPGATEHYKVIDDSPYIVNITQHDVNRDLEAVAELVKMFGLLEKRMRWRLKNTKKKMTISGEARKAALIKKIHS